MTRRSRGLRRCIALAVLFLCFAGCDDAVPVSGGRGTGTATAKPAAKAAEGEQRKAEALVLVDEDFVESERNRDPFRSYATAFQTRPPEEMQRRVIMPTTSVEEMRLIAIVTGMPRPTAMLVDPVGVGHPVERGDYIGRPRVIQATGSVAMMLNWRVDRIRENEVVLTQQDPSDPTRTALTKVLLLRPEVTASL
jgi:type IV pilus assembly protein PilP